MPSRSPAGDLLKEARRLAGLSQRGLADRARTAQSVVARIELGLASPSVATLVRLLAAAGFELAPRLAPKPSLAPADLAEAERLSGESPEERLRGGVGGQPARLDVGRIVAALGWHQVRYVLTGVLAARLHGMPRQSIRIDLVPARDVQNLKALAAALRELGPKVYADAVPDGLSFDCSATQLSRANEWDLVTDAGRVALVFESQGTGSFDELAARGARVGVFKTEIVVASLADVIRSVARLDRPEDRHDLLLLNHLASEAGVAPGAQ